MYISWLDLADFPVLSVDKSGQVTLTYSVDALLVQLFFPHQVKKEDGVQQVHEATSFCGFRYGSASTGRNASAEKSPHGKKSHYLIEKGQR